MRRSIEIALTSVMGSLAILTTISGAYRFLAFPLAPYLKFDPAEIIDVLAYFIGGSKIGFLAATIHFLGLLMFTGDPLGSTMKFLAVTSMLIGIHLSKVKGYNRLALYLLASTSRILVMTVVNAYVLYFLFPDFLTFFDDYASAVGLSGEIGLLSVALIITSIYNLLHVPFTLIPSELAYKAISSSISFRFPESRG